MPNNPSYFSRKKLPHDIPAWVPEGAIYLITINCEPRGKKQLALQPIASAIEKSLLHYQSLGKWWIHLFLLMPDHLHGLVCFSREVSMRKVVKNWKHYLSTHENIQWQVDFFDFRIRDSVLLEEKWHYIKQNPVRQGLVGHSDEWPYQWHYGGERGNK